ncbi:MAG: hypothetical protein AAF725_25640 [Acidobacteriota bacterium]
MSVVENYRDETLMTEMFPYLYDLGFRLLHVEGGWGHPETGEIFQVDGIFFRV